MTKAEEGTRVFLSYSWDNELHRTWVRYFAEQLMDLGLDVRLDQWHASPGQNLPLFMEQEVVRADYVVVVCTKLFAEKANSRTGGAGYEQQIVTGQLLQGRLANRIIPVLRSGDRVDSIPIYLTSTYALDAREDGRIGEVVEDIARKVLGRPRFAPPDPGSPPNLATQRRTEFPTGSTAYNAASRWTDYCRAVRNELKQDVALGSSYIHLRGRFDNSVQSDNSVPFDVSVEFDNNAEFDNSVEFDVETEFFRWLADPRERMLAILGDYGAGKTTLLRHLSSELADRRIKDDSWPLPVLVSLRQYRRAPTLADVFHATLSRYGISSEDWTREATRKGAVVFLDGFDELADRFSQTEAFQHFLEIDATLSPNITIVLTCRTHFFENALQEQATLAYRKIFHTELLPQKEARLPTIYLVSLTKKQEDEYLRVTQGNSWSEARKTIDSVYDLADLASRPILLNMIVRLLPEIRRLTGPISAARLYEIAVEGWLHREQWRGFQPRDVTQFIEEVAFEMNWRHGGSLVYEDLRTHITQQFESKILSRIDAEEWEGKVRTSLFLHRDVEGRYSFMHKSFLEYFVARRYVRTILAGQYADFKGIHVRGSEPEAAFCRELFPQSEFEKLFLMLEVSGPIGDNAAGIIIGLHWPIPFTAESGHVDRMLDIIASAPLIPTTKLCLDVIRAVNARRVLPKLVDILRTRSIGRSGFEILRFLADLGDPAIIPNLEDLIGTMGAALERARRKESRQRPNFNDANAIEEGRKNRISLPRAGHYDSSSLYHRNLERDFVNWEIKISDIKECIRKILAAAGK